MFSWKELWRSLKYVWATIWSFKIGKNLVDLSRQVVFVEFDEIRQLEGTIFCDLVAPVTVVDREEAGLLVELQNGVVRILDLKNISK